MNTYWPFPVNAATFAHPVIKKRWWNSGSFYRTFLLVIVDLCAYVFKRFVGVLVEFSAVGQSFKKTRSSSCNPHLAVLDKTEEYKR